jgi:hypothetical protein
MPRTLLLSLPNAHLSLSYEVLRDDCPTSRSIESRRKTMPRSELPDACRANRRAHFRDLGIVMP